MTNEEKRAFVSKKIAEAFDEVGQVDVPIFYVPKDYRQKFVEVEAVLMELDFENKSGVSNSLAVFITLIDYHRISISDLRKAALAIATIIQSFSADTSPLTPSPDEVN